ncbi:MAG: ectoine hydrolase DoeA [Sulfitobacter litoralis]|jgi:ectoine hydrolase|uniref:Ectoine hydrolase n=2 Tax=root TaxID=1 RepID=A0A1H0RS15_9RHOB|nr:MULTISPECIES: ectoine hydrolase DoeA [Sulfitobacter]MBQ0716053.1 ectoine hydrolase DoeA [Sulfitobacter litoralis]MBQ0765955.1 ectoine hydrolase DoeA [Sulfitobacter litoralis]MBQ0800507.1 ectoine hydrolase DoeA [Sulfitobacter litoralis]MCF7726757.1 ectoine hydrolase DoeA [Sulfitobacter sp. M22]MCF7778133.1 ectoine hydrolase DoeA [Sulfitobacter sp. M220]|tara:strand:- start:1676 stop:2851 length:1176 start_codon:yes stop_codon:yes gene_type:complete
MIDHSFTQPEYAARLAKTRAEMATRGLDALFVTDPSNMAWLAGYDGWSFYVHQGVLLTHEGQPVWWGRAMDSAGAQRTTYLDDDNIVGYDDTYVQNPDKHPMEDLARLIAARGLENARIGFELDNYYFTASAFLTLQTRLPGVNIQNATALVNWQRAVKSPTELEYMRRAARIVERMHEVIREKAEVGMRKNDLIADIYHASVSGAHGHWGDYPACVPMTPSGLDATAPHITWDDAPLRNNEGTFFEIAGAHRRYQCPQSRTLFLGKPPQKYLDAENAVLEAIDAGLEQAKPGNRCEDIARAFNTNLRKRGFEKDSRCGYAIGLSYPPDWGERTMSFRAGDTTVLEPGMTFHFMPALWLDDGGIEITEPIVITETGADCLCTTPRALMIKE